jgi:uncharacterized protein with FMN-binding domain
MRRVVLALFSTVTGLVMLLSFKTHSTSAASVPAATSTTGPGTSSDGESSSAATPSTTPSSAASSSSSAASSSSSAASSSSSAASSSSSASSAATKTVTGDSIDTRWGPVQVQITVTNGTLTAVNAVVYPQNNPRDEQINAYAIPQLNQEALSAKSASIDMVSGATYTSEGYLSSLQSALDQAGL